MTTTMTLYHEPRPIYGRYGSLPSVCDRIALDEIALYSDLLTAVAEAESSGSADGGEADRLSWAEIDRALGLGARDPRESGTP